MTTLWRPTVSIVTITLRDLAGLRRTLSSTWAQSGEFDVEQVVIDGGSGRDVEQYLHGQGSRLAYWHSRPDRGRYDAMNLGMARCTGDLVWFMHSGDRFADSHAVASVVEVFGSGGPDALRAGWGFGQVRLVDAAGHGGRVWGYRSFDVRRFAFGDRPIPHQAAFFGAELLRRLGDYDIDFGLAADQLYILRAALVRPPTVLDRIVCDFDTTGAGSTRSFRDHYRDVRAAWDETGYFPLGNRPMSRLGSGLVEGVARGKYLVREVVSGR